MTANVTGQFANLASAGSVTFTYDGGTFLGTVPLTAVNSGLQTAAISTSTLAALEVPAGPHTFSAAYTGSQIYVPSTGTLPFTVTAPTATATALLYNPANSLVGQSVVFEAHVTNPLFSAQTSAGYVTFFNNSGSGDVPVALAVPLVPDGAGVQIATYTTPTPPATVNPAAVYSYHAAYLGTAAYLPSDSGAKTQTVWTAFPTTTTLTLGPSGTSQPNQPVTFTAQVASPYGPAPTGAVYFYNSDGALVGTGGVGPTGQASFTVPLPAGNYSYYAQYAGDANFAPSASLPGLVYQTVAGPTTTFLVTSPGPWVVGQGVTFTAEVNTPFGATPTGTVTFSADGVGFATMALTASTQGAYAYATLPPYTGLTVGAHTIQAVYNGTPFFYTSSATLNQTVNLNPTSTSLAADVNPAGLGQAVTFTAAVNGMSGAAPTGTVAFQDGNITLDTETLDANGQALFTTSELSAGPHTLTAVYSGDSTFVNGASLAANADGFKLGGGGSG